MNIIDTDSLMMISYQATASYQERHSSSATLSIILY
jgi:hypothetical protein